MLELPSQFIELETSRFVIRTLQPGDAGSGLESWTLDPLVAQMMNSEMKKWTIERQRSFFTEALVRIDRRVLGIFPISSNRPIGMYILKLNPHSHTYIVSTLVGDIAWRGLGVNKECGERINQFLFIEHSFHKAKANILTSNKAMIWLMSKTAWRREGRLAGHLRHVVSGERIDVYIYGLLKADWLDYQKRQRRDQSNSAVGFSA